MCINCIIDNVLAASNCEDVVPESEKLCLEGQIVQKLECRPQGNTVFTFIEIHVA
jgi:hypothetical protein